MRALYASAEKDTVYIDTVESVIILYETDTVNNYIFIIVHVSYVLHYWNTAEAIKMTICML